MAKVNTTMTPASDTDTRPAAKLQTTPDVQVQTAAPRSFVLTANWRTGGKTIAAGERVALTADEHAQLSSLGAVAEPFGR